MTIPTMNVSTVAVYSIFVGNLLTKYAEAGIIIPITSMYPLVSHWVIESLISSAAEMLGRAVANAVLIIEVAVHMTTMFRKMIFLFLSVTSIKDICDRTLVGIF
jgi:hypothetical protein